MVGGGGRGVGGAGTKQMKMSSRGWMWHLSYIVVVAQSEQQAYSFPPLLGLFPSPLSWAYFLPPRPEPECLGSIYSHYIDSSGITYAVLHNYWEWRRGPEYLRLKCVVVRWGDKVDTNSNHTHSHTHTHTHSRVWECVRYAAPHHPLGDSWDEPNLYMYCTCMMPWSVNKYSRLIVVAEKFAGNGSKWVFEDLILRPHCPGHFPFLDGRGPPAAVRTHDRRWQRRCGRIPPAAQFSEPNSHQAAGLLFAAEPGRLGTFHARAADHPTAHASGGLFAARHAGNNAATDFHAVIAAANCSEAKPREDWLQVLAAQFW